MPNFWDLYLVTDPDQGGGPDQVPHIVDQAICGGVTAVQLRDKHADDATFEERARALSEIIGARVPLFVNDRLDCALKLGLHLHIGQDDTPYEEARRALPSHLMIGLSISVESELDDIVQRCHDAHLPLPDVVGIGPVRATSTKQDAAAPLGIEGLINLAHKAKSLGMPCVAIGGVHLDNASDIIQHTVVDGLCVVSEIMTSLNPEQAARDLRKCITGSRAIRGSIPRVLSIAGTDPSGGAGLQADLKSIAAAGGYGMAVVTALVSQNTCGVRDIFSPPSEFLKQQLEAVSDDVTIDALKIGMLADSDTTAVVSEWLTKNRPPVVVLDPVMVSTSGHRLLAAEAEDAVRKFAELADYITPNIPELAVLCGVEEISSFDEAVELAKQWAQRTSTTVIVKGGHLSGPQADNALVDKYGAVYRISNPRVHSESTHGTGCSLSSALATKLAQGGDRIEAITWVTSWLREAIVHGEALGVGYGHGPVDHSHQARRLAENGKAHIPRYRELQHVPFCDGTTPHRLGPSPRNPVDLPRIAAPGPWTNALWRIGHDYWLNTLNSDFIQQLGEGSLQPKDFSFYLYQDSLYLREYSRALATLGAKAPETSDSLAWVAGSQQCIVEEAELHRTWLRDHDVNRTGMSTVTAAYTDFLKATTSLCDYVVGVAAVLPCYWLYAEVGKALSHRNFPVHPYRAWLDVYGDEDAFIEDVRQALLRAEQAFERATPQQRIAAVEAYLAACEHEYHFFDQALRQ
ncbi:bifunctional hydroxymethylpyrimidine kinase/phosphomethylpyrimidine kinase [Corynebacterium poyangense]|uniref:Thiamine-phosphate synthase n=1 Tax=Corynebacterium poyangense TaxID=2684405 RepID=A0A7H0SNS7_9CORY|nr:bifunctional hydroxymethylpyrimidine kinase/phosphomethylpyrimidine kinase [Corynebacterium poyangense]MBZ8177750.1 bifunctional hydroxymethylpyrimidine kinase/phosphomethylpyrimidine kinase [Corynebacterium poyangense]QNQ90202.1 bifunctional hydroxymethylpyrimidine kinase/phosphomethylpyrimidine kinase [Corynebacterium poyangense]